MKVTEFDAPGFQRACMVHHTDFSGVTQIKGWLKNSNQPEPHYVLLVEHGTAARTGGTTFELALAFAAGHAAEKYLLKREIIAWMEDL